jgi:hypothetical protein
MLFTLILTCCVRNRTWYQSGTLWEIMLDNNMIDILHCSSTNAFESDGLCNGMRALLERMLSGSIESKTDYKTGICCFAIKLAVLRFEGRVCLQWNCPRATSTIIQIQSSISLTERNLFVPWCSLTISDYLNLISVLLTYFHYYQNYPHKGDLSRIWLF